MVAIKHPAGILSTEHLERHAVAPLFGFFHRHEHTGTAVARESALTPQDIRRHDCMKPGPALGSLAHVVDRPVIGLHVAFRYGLIVRKELQGKARIRPVARNQPLSLRPTNRKWL